MKRAMALGVVAVLATAGYGCKNLNPMGGGGSDYVMPANSPVMYCLAHYKVGQLAKYKMEAGGNSSEMYIKCLGQSGDKWWVETGMSASGMDFAHLLLVDSSGKVSKAWYSGKDSKEWKETTINEMPSTTGGTECGACKKTHKEGTMNWGAGSFDVGGKSLTTEKCDATGYNCEGGEVKSTMHFSKDVPMLYCMKGWVMDKGGLACMEYTGGKTCLVDFKNEGAEPKHKLPEVK